MIARRRLLHFAPPALLALAIASYGALLYAAHGAALRDDALPRYVQRFGTEASARTGALADPSQGALAMGSTATSQSSAEWHFDPLDASFPQGTTVRNEEVFVTGLDFALYRPSSYASIMLDGKQIGLLKPLLSNDAGGGPFPVGNAPLRTIDIPPGVEQGFRFDIPAPSGCAASGCTLRIDVVRASWIVRRVGLLFGTVATGTNLSQSSGAPWIMICFAAVVLAALSHLVLSVRLGRTKHVTTTEWKAL